LPKPQSASIGRASSFAHGHVAPERLLIPTGGATERLPHQPPGNMLGFGVQFSVMNFWHEAVEGRIAPQQKRRKAAR
jgi:hypothetical protein